MWQQNQVGNSINHTRLAGARKGAGHRAARGRQVRQNPQQWQSLDRNRGVRHYKYNAWATKVQGLGPGTGRLKHKVAGMG